MQQQSQLQGEHLPVSMGSLTSSVLSLLLLSACEGQVANSSAGCGLLMEGESHQSVMLTRPGPAPAILVEGEGCGVRLLVVGGGGRGGDYAGGGSGHLEYRSL